MSYEYPKYWHLPPFFTVQPVKETQAKQVQLWSDLILSYCRHHKHYEIDVREASTWDLFNQREIGRSLSVDEITFFLDEMAKAGNVQWQGGGKARCTVHFRTPQQWGKEIYDWAIGQGKVNTVLTMYEIAHGDEAKDMEFYGIDDKALRQALATLEKQGKAEVFGGGTGVKFF